MEVTKKVEVLRTKNTGMKYLGIKLFTHDMQEALKMWYTNADLLGEDISMATIQSKRIDRDGDSHHMTILNPHEYSKIEDSEKLDAIVGKEVTIKMLGIGKVTKKMYESHYVVVKSLDSDILRNNLDLLVTDLHITLGFNYKDVFDAKKDEDTIYLKF